MSAAKIMGVVLIMLGTVALIYKGFSYTQKEKIVDLGAIEATADVEKNVNIPIWAGVVVLGGGIVLLAVGRGAKA